jgi:hypothetical protein
MDSKEVKGANEGLIKVGAGKNDTDNAGDKARLGEFDQEGCGHNEQFLGARKRSPRTGVAL